MLHFQKPCCAIIMLLVIFTFPTCPHKSLMVAGSISECSMSIGTSLLSRSLKVPCPFAFLKTKTGNKAKRTHSHKCVYIHRFMCIFKFQDPCTTIIMLIIFLSCMCSLRSLMVPSSSSSSEFSIYFGMSLPSKFLKTVSRSMFTGIPSGR